MENTKHKKISALKVVSKFFQSSEFGIIIPLIVLMIITALVNKNFFTLVNFTTMLKTIPFIACATLGASLPLITGDLDISVGRLSGLAGMVFAWCMVGLHYSLPVALLVTLLLGVAFGLVNGLLVILLKMPPFIVTMGTLYISGGMRFLLNRGAAINPLPYGLAEFGKATVLGISYAFWIVVALFAILFFVQKKMVFGRQMYAVGSNREVATLQGINNTRVRLVTYVICDVLAAISGILAAIDINSAVPQAGNGWEFRAVAACAVGGVSLSGGKGSALGVALGTFIVFILNNILIMLGISSYLQDMFVGVILAGAVMFDMYRQRRKIKE